MVQLLIESGADINDRDTIDQALSVHNPFIGHFLRVVGGIHELDIWMSKASMLTHTDYRISKDIFAITMKSLSTRAAEFITRFVMPTSSAYDTLYKAIMLGNVTQVKELLASPNYNTFINQHYNIFINQQDKLGATLLMYAGTMGTLQHLAIVKQLLNHGANPLLETNNGMNIFDLITYIMNNNHLSESQQKIYTDIVVACCRRLHCRHLRLIQKVIFNEMGHELPHETLGDIAKFIVGSTIYKESYLPNIKASKPQPYREVPVVNQQDEAHDMPKEVVNKSGMDSDVELPPYGHNNDRMEPGQVPVVPVDRVPQIANNELVQVPNVSPTIAASWLHRWKLPVIGIGVAGLVAYYLYQRSTQEVLLDNDGGVIPTGFDAPQLVNALNYLLNQHEYDIAYELINANREAFNSLSKQQQQDFLTLLPLA